MFDENKSRNISTRQEKDNIGQELAQQLIEYTKYKSVINKLVAMEEGIAIEKRDGSRKNQQTSKDQQSRNRATKH